jgi:hypothetical protein
MTALMLALFGLAGLMDRLEPAERTGALVITFTALALTSWVWLDIREDGCVSLVESPRD